MGENDRAQGVDSIKGVDSPEDRESVNTSDHQTDHGEAEDEGEFELLGQLGDLSEEVGVLDFLGCCAPGHVDLEKMG